MVNDEFRAEKTLDKQNLRAQTYSNNVKLHQTATEDAMMKSAVKYGQADVVCALAILLLGALLVASGAGLADQWQHSPAHQAGLLPQQLLGTLAAVGGAALVIWWLLAFAAAAVGSLFERMGKPTAAAVSRKLSPAFMQRLVLAALSAQLVSGPAATAAVPAPGPEWTPHQGLGATAPVSPGGSADNPPDRSMPTELLDDGGPIDRTLWRGAAEAQDRVTAPDGIQPLDGSSVPVPFEGYLQPDQGVLASPPTDPDSSPSSALGNAPDDVGWRPATPPVHPGLLTAPSKRADGSSPGMDTVIVLAGDTLWDIAARALGPGASEVEIALQWPRWHEANKAVIGPNANLLLPGQTLRPPPAA